MKNGVLDRALLMTILAAVGGLYWQLFSVAGDIADVRERLASVETRLEYTLLRPADPGPD